jgi:hypothetical protein
MVVIKSFGVLQFLLVQFERRTFWLRRYLKERQEFLHKINTQLVPTTGKRRATFSLQHIRLYHSA